MKPQNIFAAILALESPKTFHVEQRLGLRDRGLLRAAKQSHAGIVDKQVDASGLGQNVIDHFRDRRVVGHVADQRGKAVGLIGGRATAGCEYAKASA